MKPKPMLESENEDLIRIEASRHGIKLWRNNSGALKDETGRQVRYGLGNESKEINDRLKSSDEIGIASIIITPEMVGMTIGVFTAFEVKKPGWKYSGTGREGAQKNFIDFVTRLGGIAAFIENVDSVHNVLQTWKRNITRK